MPSPEAHTSSRSAASAPASRQRTSSGPTTALAVGSGHRDSLSQRFGYDYGVHRWDGSKWNKKLVDGGDAKKNEDYLIWDVPVRAMADGWVFSCNRNVDDNTPPTRGEKGGNSVVVVQTRPRSSSSTPTSSKGLVRNDVLPAQRERVHGRTRSAC